MKTTPTPFQIKCRAAFTLIELLVVIAIIAMLISVLLPSLRRSLSLASATVCQYNLKEIGNGILMYRVENDGWLPVADKTEESAAASASVGVGGGVEDPPSENTAWFVKLFPTYLQDAAILACPDDPFGFRMNDARNRLLDPLVADMPSYGINSFLLNFGGGKLADLDRYRPERPAETILLCDLGPDKINYANQRAVAVGGPGRNSSLVMWGDGFDPFSGLAARPWVTSRHNHGINIVTVGGSVRHVATDSVLRTPIRRYYSGCAAGKCPLCKELGWYHYSFAHERLYWWTGDTPKE